MLPLTRSPPRWIPRGYICRSCRHHLQFHGRVQSTQSTAVESAGGGSSVDDWYPENRLNGQHVQGSRLRSQRGAAQLPADTTTAPESAGPASLSLRKEGSRSGVKSSLEHETANKLSGVPSKTIEELLQRSRETLSEGSETRRTDIPDVPSTIVRKLDGRKRRKIRRDVSLYTTLLELRAKGKVSVQPAVLNGDARGDVSVEDVLREPTARFFASDHPSIRQRNQLRTSEIEARLLGLRRELRKRLGAAPDETFVDRSAPIGVEEKSTRQTAFVKNARRKSFDVSRIRTNIAFYDRALELRQQKALSAPRIHNKDILEEKIEALAQTLRDDHGLHVRSPDPMLPRRRTDRLKRALGRLQSRLARVNDAEDTGHEADPAEHTREPVDESVGQRLKSAGTYFESVVAKIKAKLQGGFGHESKMSGSLADAASSNADLQRARAGADSVKGSVATYRPAHTPAHNDAAAANPRSQLTTPDVVGDSSSEAAGADTSHRSKKRASQDTSAGYEGFEIVSSLFADSPADLAELNSSPTTRLRSSQTGMDQASKIRAPRNGILKSPNLEDLRKDLGADVLGKMGIASVAEQIKHEQRAKAVEHNVQIYDKQSHTMHPTQIAGVKPGPDPSHSLAKLHTSSPSNRETEDRADAKKSEPVEPIKPATTKTRKKRVLSGKAKKAVSASTANAHKVGEIDSKGSSSEHKPLWEAMQYSATTDPPDSSTTDPPESSKRSEDEPLPLEPADDTPPTINSVKAADLQIEALDIEQPPVPSLEYGLDKVLFNPGVYQMQDPTSRVYNFDPYLQHIMPAQDFDFSALKQYKTSSEDKALAAIAKEHEKRYVGSTSSMTSTLAHFHYLLSNWRPLNLAMLSRGFIEQAAEFTKINKAPSAIFLRWKPESMTYAIDADKEYDGANVLMMLGKSMEKMLTMPTEEFEKYRKSDPREVSAEMRNEPEAFQYTTMGDFLMRSQLDAHDSRLPGTGMFDLKTRAVLSVRMDAEDFEPMLGYEIHTLQGRWNSYEREYYDMMRATMLKYMLQARMGRMQGIFAAYHNVQRIFGFQYIPMMDMDRGLHGQIDPCLGDQEFKLSLNLLNTILNKATAKYPEKSLRIHFESTSQNLGGGNPTPVMSIFAEPMDEQEIKRIQSTSKDKVRAFEERVMGVNANTAEALHEEATGETTKSQKAPTAERAPATAQPSSDSPNSVTLESEKDAVPTMCLPVSSDASAMSSADADMDNSSSEADSDFLASLATRSRPWRNTTSNNSPSDVEPSTDIAPLFAATLMIKSKVNGTHVDRPELLKPEDEWTVEYLLTEYPESEATWARYVASKGRRKEILTKEKDEDEDVTLTESDKKKRSKGDAFIDFLRSLAKRGREFRKEMDASEAGREKKFAWKMGETTTAPAAGAAANVGAAAAEASQVQDVDGYMSWLYDERGRKA